MLQKESCTLLHVIQIRTQRLLSIKCVVTGYKTERCWGLLLWMWNAVELWYLGTRGSGWGWEEVDGNSRNHCMVMFKQIFRSYTGLGWTITWKHESKSIKFESTVNILPWNDMFFFFCTRQQNALLF